MLVGNASFYSSFSVIFHTDPYSEPGPIGLISAHLLSLCFCNMEGRSNILRGRTCSRFLITQIIFFRSGIILMSMIIKQFMNSFGSSEI